MIEVAVTIEDVRLEGLERDIEHGLCEFAKVGFALHRIREERLYRNRYSTFEEYCQDRWGIVASRARQLIAAAGVTENLKSVTNVTLPVNEGQTRSLVGLQPDIQRQVWTRAVATAPEGKVTAAHVERTVADLHGVASHRAERSKQVLDDEGDIPATVTLRVARVVYLLALGKWMQLTEIAEKTGLTENGAWRLMARLAGGHHVPVTEMDGKWGILNVDSQDMPY